MTMSSAAVSNSVPLDEGEDDFKDDGLVSTLADIGSIKDLDQILDDIVSLNDFGKIPGCEDDDGTPVASQDSSVNTTQATYGSPYQEQVSSHVSDSSLASDQNSPSDLADYPSRVTTPISDIVDIPKGYLTNYKDPLSSDADPILAIANNYEPRGLANQSNNNKHWMLDDSSDGYDYNGNYESNNMASCATNSAGNSRGPFFVPQGNYPQPSRDDYYNQGNANYPYSVGQFNQTSPIYKANYGHQPAPMSDYRHQDPPIMSSGQQTRELFAPNQAVYNKISKNPPAYDSNHNQEVAKSTVISTHRAIGPPAAAVCTQQATACSAMPNKLDTTVGSNKMTPESTDSEVKRILQIPKNNLNQNVFKPIEPMKNMLANCNQLPSFQQFHQFQQHSQNQPSNINQWRSGDGIRSNQQVWSAASNLMPHHNDIHMNHARVQGNGPVTYNQPNYKRLPVSKERIDVKSGNFSGGSVLYLNHHNRAMPTLQSISPRPRPATNQYPAGMANILLEQQKCSAPISELVRSNSSGLVRTFTSRPIPDVHPYARLKATKQMPFAVSEGLVAKEVNVLDERPKTFEMELIEVGKFKLEAVYDERSDWSTKVKVAFAMRRLIYEFPFREVAGQQQMGVNAMRHYAIIVPFDCIATIRQEGQEIALTLKSHPTIFDSLTMQQQVMVAKNVTFDRTNHLGPLIGQFKLENRHKLQLREKQADRFIASLLAFDRHLFQSIIKSVVPCPTGRSSILVVSSSDLMDDEPCKKSMPVLTDKDKEVVISSQESRHTYVGDEQLDKSCPASSQQSVAPVMSLVVDLNLMPKMPTMASSGMDARAEASNSSNSMDMADCEPCKCRTACRSARCPCFKNNRSCNWNGQGEKNRCSCDNCVNPLNTLKHCGISASDAMMDICLARYVNGTSSTVLFRDLTEEVIISCCGTKRLLHECVPGITKCPNGPNKDECRTFQHRFSWCKKMLVNLRSNSVLHCPQCDSCQTFTDNMCPKCQYSY